MISAFGILHKSSQSAATKTARMALRLRRVGSAPVPKAADIGSWSEPWKPSIERMRHMERRSAASSMADKLIDSDKPAARALLRSVEGSSPRGTATRGLTPTAGRRGYWNARRARKDGALGQLP